MGDEDGAGRVGCLGKDFATEDVFGSGGVGRCECDGFGFDFACGGFDGEPSFGLQGGGTERQGVGDGFCADGDVVQEREVLSGYEGVVTHPVENVVEGGEVEGAEGECGICTFGFEDDEGEPVGEGDISVVDELDGGFAVGGLLAQGVKEFVELGLLAAGFKDGHDIYNLAIYNVQFILQQSSKNYQPCRGGGARSFGVGSRCGVGGRGCR